MLKKSINQFSFSKHQKADIDTSLYK